MRLGMKFKMNKVISRMQKMAVAKAFAQLWHVRCKIRQIRTMMGRWKYRWGGAVFQKWAEQVAYELAERQRLSEQAQHELQVRLFQIVPSLSHSLTSTASS
jgi:hypothetical protein